MRITRIAVALLVVAAPGALSAVPTATIPSAEIQPLASAILARTPSATVKTQFGDLLSRYAPAKLPIATVEGLLNQVLRETVAQANRDTEALLAVIQQNNQVREALSRQTKELSSRSLALRELVNTTSTALTVAHGDSLVSAAEQGLAALQLLERAAEDLREVRDQLKLEFQQASDRLDRVMQYLVQVTKALNEITKANVRNFTL